MVGASEYPMSDVKAFVGAEGGSGQAWQRRETDATPQGVPPLALLALQVMLTEPVEEKKPSRHRYSALNGSALVPGSPYAVKKTAE